MSLSERVILNLEERRERILSGKVNCIPLGLPRFESEWPGIEQKSIIQITANTKVGKSQITDFLLLYNVLEYAMEHPDQIRVKIFYFSLEMSKEQKFQQYISHLLFKLSHGKIRVTPRDLRSTRADAALPTEILDIIKTDAYQRHFNFFEEHVEIIDDIRNGYGIFKMLSSYAKANGTQYKKKIQIIDNKTKESTEVEVDDFYAPNDPEEYVISIVDHMALLTPENGGTIRDAMVKFSSEYAITLRNKYKYIIGEVIQQAAKFGNVNFFTYICILIVN